MAGNAGFGGRLIQQYNTTLARAYDEVAKSMSHEQVAETNDYARRVVQDEQFRHALSTTRRDSDQVNAQLASARKHASQAQAHFAQRETLAEQARVAKSDSASLGYDWTRDPRNTRELEALAFQLRDAPTAHQQQIVIDRFIAEKAMLSRPTHYSSGTGIIWSDANLREAHGHVTATPEFQDDTRDTHAYHTTDVGPLRLTPPGDRGLTDLSHDAVATVKAEAGQARRELSKGQIATQQRFDRQSGLAGQDRDGKFGSNQSTATRAFDNAVEDGKRSVENFKDAAEEAVFGRVYRWLNPGDKKK